MCFSLSLSHYKNLSLDHIQKNSIYVYMILIDEDGMILCNNMS